MKVKGIPQTGGASLKTVTIFWNNTKLHRDQIGRKYVAFDVETTGLYPRRGDRIIEIGAVSIQDGITASEFHSLVMCQGEYQNLHSVSMASQMMIYKMLQCQNRYFYNLRIS